MRTPKLPRRLRLVARLGLQVALVLGLAAFLFYRGLASRAQGRTLAEVQPSQVGVLIDHRSGEVELLLQPGVRGLLPWFEDVFVFDRGPRVLRLEGEVWTADGVDPRLVVRAPDGSKFWFESIDVEFQIVPELAERLLPKNGASGRLLECVRACARPVLEEELGVFDAQQVVDAAFVAAALQRADERLDALLADYGLEVVHLSVSKPKFEREYEVAIEQRKEVGQRASLASDSIPLLERQIEQAIVDLEAKKRLERLELQGAIDAERIQATTNDQQARADADAYALKRATDRALRVAELAVEAEALRASIDAQDALFRAELDALAQRGDLAVREELVRVLADATLRFVPYSRDPAPDRVEHASDVQLGALTP